MIIAKEASVFVVCDSCGRKRQTLLIAIIDDVSGNHESYALCAICIHNAARISQKSVDAD